MKISDSVSLKCVINVCNILTATFIYDLTEIFSVKHIPHVGKYPSVYITNSSKGSI